MYTIPLKDNSKEIDLVVIRSLLALAGITAFFYRSSSYVFINIIISLILLATAVGVNYIISILRVKKILLLGSAALLLFVTTQAITFAVLLVAFGMVSSLIYKKPSVLLSEKGITVTSSKGNAVHDWDEFENIVLKDNLLSLDYKNNKLLQLEVDTAGGKSLDEKTVNDFCWDCLQKNVQQMKAGI